MFGAERRSIKWLKFPPFHIILIITSKVLLKTEREKKSHGTYHNFFISTYGIYRNFFISTLIFATNFITFIDRENLTVHFNY